MIEHGTSQATQVEAVIGFHGGLGLVPTGAEIVLGVRIAILLVTIPAKELVLNGKDTAPKVDDLVNLSVRGNEIFLPVVFIV
jgi:hypothetical protein